MRFTEEYRSQCNPMKYDLVDVMLGARGRRRADSRRISSTPSAKVCTAILLGMAAMTVGITALAIWKVTR